MKRMLLPALFAVSLFQTASAQGDYGFTSDIQQANILHCFDWKFSDIKAELPRIAEAGFGSVQVSPVQGNAGSSAEWFYAYMPFDFAFRENGNGSREELRELCAEAEKYGIKIIVDVVANHINKAASRHHVWWNGTGYLRDLGSINYNSRSSITHNNLGDYKDVVSENADVQQRALDFVRDLKSLGVKGIRWDAAKHIGLPSENCDFWSVVCGEEGLWHYGEILDNPGTNNDKEWKVLQEYARYMSVTDNVFARTIINLYKGQNAPTKFANHCSATSTGHGVSADKVVYWAESHDTYANDGGETKGLSQDLIDRVYCFMACREKETALYLSRPFETERTRIRMGVKGSVNALENKAVGAVNRFRVAMTGKKEQVKLVAGKQGFSLFARQDGGFVIIMPKAVSGDIDVENPGGFVLPGTYKDEVHGTSFSVTKEKITGHVGSSGYAVVIAGNSGVNEIAGETVQGVPVYYNLQGIRVEKPERGLYIKVEGNKRTKVLF